MAKPKNFLSNYNQFVKGMSSFGNPSASFMASPLGKLGTQAGQMGQANAISNFAQRPTLRSGITSAATYAFNANPYYAGINALTGGALDRGVGSLVSGAGRMLGLNRRKAPGAQQQEEEINYARSATDIQNRMLGEYGRQQREQEQAGQEIENFRTAQRNLAAYGMSDRAMAGPLAAMLNPANRATEAARANLAAGMSQRGISGGIAEGARAALEGAVAQAGAQAGTQMAQQVFERSNAMQDALLAADTARREQASKTGMSALAYAADIPTTLMQLQQQRQQQEFENRMARRKFEMAQAEQIGTALGRFGPDLFNRLKKKPEPLGMAKERAGMADSVVRVPEFPGAESVTYDPYGGTGYSNPEQFGYRRASSPNLFFNGMPSERTIGLAEPSYTRPIELSTQSRLDQNAGLTLPGSTYYDPVTGLTFQKQIDGSWRKL